MVTRMWTALVQVHAAAGGPKNLAQVGVTAGEGLLSSAAVSQGGAGGGLTSQVDLSLPR